MGRCNHGNEHYHRMREIHRLAKEPATFQAGLCSMDLFIIYLFGFWLVSWLVDQ
jgi:hypothetical protein